MGFCQWVEMAPKVGFSVQKWEESGYISLTFDPFRDFRETPLFLASLRGVEIVF